jgi:hypothetical protein
LVDVLFDLVQAEDGDDLARQLAEDTCKQYFQALKELADYHTQWRAAVNYLTDNLNHHNDAHNKAPTFQDPEVQHLLEYAMRGSTDTFLLDIFGVWLSVLPDEPLAFMDFEVTIGMSSKLQLSGDLVVTSAAHADVRPGDAVLGVDRKPVTTLADFHACFEPGSKLMFRRRR